MPIRRPLCAAVQRATAASADRKPWRERPHVRARSVARHAPQRVVHAASCLPVSPSVARWIRGGNASPSAAITSADHRQICSGSAAVIAARVRREPRSSGPCPSRPSRGHHGARLGAVKTAARRAAAGRAGASGLDRACGPRASRQLRDGRTSGRPLLDGSDLVAQIPVRTSPHTLTRGFRGGSLAKNLASV